MKKSGPAGPGINLLRFSLVRSIYLSPLFPYLLQGAILVLFVVLAVIGWGLFAPDGVPGKQFAKTNIVNLTIWGVWWPAMVWIAVLFGRSWCAICPLELVANLTERMGRLLGVRQLVLGPWLKGGVLILAFYALIQLLVAGAELHRVPNHTSIFLWSLIGLAAVTGFFYKDRAFCRGFCPVGLLLAVYGRGSMLAVRSTETTTCDACPGKDCRNVANRDHLDARSCPSLLSPATLNDNVDCLVCGQCMKVCPSDNMGLWLRWPFHPSDRRAPIASMPVTLFVMLVSGFVIYELFSEWKAAKEVYLKAPQWFAELAGLSVYEGWIKGVWMLAVVPLVVWSILGGLVWLLGGARSLSEACRRLALPLAVVIAAGHMAKALAKIVSWAGYLPLALRDPAGGKAALAISSGTMTKPAALMSIAVVSVLSLTLVAVMGYFALRESRLADAATHRSRVPSLLLATLAAAFLIFEWGFHG